MSLECKIAWKNGLQLPAAQAVLPVEDMGIVHGLSVTEMLRTFSGKAYAVEKHLDRLVHSADLAGIAIDYSKSEIADRLEEVVHQNRKCVPDWQELGVIVFATPGMNSTYTGNKGDVEPTLLIHTFDMPGELWERPIEFGQHLAISKVPMIPDVCQPVSAKTRSRLVYYLADQEVQKRTGICR